MRENEEDRVAVAHSLEHVIRKVRLLQSLLKNLETSCKPKTKRLFRQESDRERIVAGAQTPSCLVSCRDCCFRSHARLQQKEGWQWLGRPTIILSRLMHSKMVQAKSKAWYGSQGLRQDLAEPSRCLGEDPRQFEPEVEQTHNGLMISSPFLSKGSVLLLSYRPTNNGGSCTSLRSRQRV